MQIFEFDYTVENWNTLKKPIKSDDPLRTFGNVFGALNILYVTQIGEKTRELELTESMDETYLVRLTNCKDEPRYEFKKPQDPDIYVDLQVSLKTTFSDFEEKQD